MKKRGFNILLVISCIILAFLIVLFYKKPQLFSSYEIGEPIDSLNHVNVYYNGGTGTVEGRNTSADGYNIGLKYQCVEFVKRYYYEYYHHKMPNSYGHAISFFNKELKDGQLNVDRDLMQYSNPSSSKPKVGDLLVMDATTFNGYGHVAIVSEVNEDEIEIIQQNPGATASSRVWIDLEIEGATFRLSNDRVLGWLRMK